MSLNIHLGNSVGCSTLLCFGKLFIFDVMVNPALLVFHKILYYWYFEKSWRSIWVTKLQGYLFFVSLIPVKKSYFQIIKNSFQGYCHYINNIPVIFWKFIWVLVSKESTLQGYLNKKFENLVPFNVLPLARR